MSLLCSNNQCYKVKEVQSKLSILRCWYGSIDGSFVEGPAACPSSNRDRSIHADARRMWRLILFTNTIDTNSTFVEWADATQF